MQPQEVTYVGPDGTLSIRMTENTTTAMCVAARNLRACYFVAVDGWSMLEDAPIWSVFDMRTAQRDTPVPGQWSINDPVKTFPFDALDGAVMYALALMSK